MSAAALLVELRAAGAELRVVGGRLVAKHLPPALAPQARTHAAELRTLLAEPPSVAPPPPAPAPVDRAVESELVGEVRPPAPLLEQAPVEADAQRAARHGFRLDRWGSYVDDVADSKDLTPPFRPWFAVGWNNPDDHGWQENRAMLAAVELSTVRERGPLPAPTAEPVPSCPIRARAWEAAYQRRLSAGLDPASAARLTVTTHGPRLVPRVEPPPEPPADGA